MGLSFPLTLLRLCPIAKENSTFGIGETLKVLGPQRLRVAQHPAARPPTARASPQRGLRTARQL